VRDDLKEQIKFVASSIFNNFEEVSPSTSNNNAMKPCPEYFIGARCKIGFDRDCSVNGACEVAQHHS